MPRHANHAVSNATINNARSDSDSDPLTFFQLGPAQPIIPSNSLHLPTLRHTHTRGYALRPRCTLRIPTHRNRINHLLERLKELRVHGPIPQIASTLLEARGENIGVLEGVEAEDLVVRVGPVEAEVFAEAAAEFGVRSVAFVFEDEVVAEAGPDEEVDDEGVGEAFLGGARAEPGGDGGKVFFGGGGAVLVG
jgi:hypothetical protein